MGETRTWKIPRLGLVDIDIRDRTEAEASAADLPAQIVAHQFLVGGVETESRLQRIEGILLHGDLH